MTDYYPNSLNCTAWKWTEIVSGSYVLKTPNERGKTPSNIQTEGTELTAAEKNMVSTDDDNYVEASASEGSGQTARGAIMTKFVITENEADVTKLVQLCRGAHLNASAYVKHYLWDYGNGNWFYLSDDVVGQTKDTHDSELTENLGNYIDGDIIYFLEWDYTGHYTSPPVEGCFSEDTKFSTPRGIKSAEELEIDAEVWAWKDGEKVRTKIIGKTEHFTGKFKIYEFIGQDFRFGHTGVHPVYTKKREKRADQVAVGDVVFKLEDGKLREVKIKKINIKKISRVFDFRTSVGNMFLDNGILAHNLKLQAEKW